MSLPLTLFLVVMFAAGLGAALLLGDLKRFIIAAVLIALLIGSATNAISSARTHLAHQITRTLPSAFR